MPDRQELLEHGWFWWDPCSALHNPIKEESLPCTLEILIPWGGGGGERIEQVSACLTSVGQFGFT